MQDIILVKPIDQPSTLILHEQYKDRHTMGEVIAVGPGKRTRKGVYVRTELQAGDMVYFADGEDIIVDGEHRIVIREPDIAAVIND